MDNSLPKEIKSQWLEALRHGSYTQGTGALRKDGNLFCCLGVLIDVIEPDSWVPPEGGNCFGLKTHEGQCLLPEHVMDKTGLTHGDQWNLAHMNDIRTPFPEIADWIEVNL